MRNISTELRNNLNTLIGSMGYEFVGCELAQPGRQTVLRIYIDSATGVTIDDCSKVSRQISAMLDVENPVQGQYLLEVSSPGIDRPLFTMADYQKYIGRQVKIRLHSPINQRRQFSGLLKLVEGDNIYLQVEDTEVILAFSNIAKANIIAEVRL